MPSRATSDSPKTVDTSSTKRKRRSDADATDKRTRTSDRFREPSSTPQRSTARSSSTQTVESALPITQRSTDMGPPVVRRQTARRSAGRLPPGPGAPPTVTAATLSRSNERRRSTIEVEIPRRPPSRSRPALVSDDSESDSEREDLGVGTPGPGPRTSRSRATRGRQLDPVPQPSPSAFHPYLRGRHSQAEAITDFPSSSMTGSPPATQDPESLGPRRKTIIDGEEAYVMSDSDGDSADPDGGYQCRWAGCSQVLKSSANLARHIRAHADAYDPRPSAAPRTPTTPNDPALLKQVGALEAELSKRKEDLRQTKDLLKQRLDEFRELRSDELAARTAITELQRQLRVSKETATKQAADLQAELEVNEATASAASAKLATLESQVKERDQKLLALQAQVKIFEDADAEIAELAAPVPTEDGEPPVPEVHIKYLKKRLKQTNTSLKHTQSDLDFIRSQYQQASTSAVQEVARAKQLDEQVARLKEQLTLGLKQRELHNRAVTEQSSAASNRREMQLKLLLEQSRRTDDTIRRKAAAQPRLVKENRELEAALHKARSSADDLSKRNNELVDQNALLRGRLMGAFEDPVQDSDDETDDDLPILPSALPVLVPDFVDDAKATPPAQLVNATLADGGIEAFRCKWSLGGDAVCPEIFHTRDELETHGIGHIQKLALDVDVSQPM